MAASYQAATARQRMPSARGRARALEGAKATTDAPRSSTELCPRLARGHIQLSPDKLWISLRLLTRSEVEVSSFGGAATACAVTRNDPCLRGCVWLAGNKPARCPRKQVCCFGACMMLAYPARIELGCRPSNWSIPALSLTNRGHMHARALLITRRSCVKVLHARFDGCNASALVLPRKQLSSINVPGQSGLQAAARACVSHTVRSTAQQRTCVSQPSGAGGVDFSTRTSCFQQPMLCCVPLRYNFLLSSCCSGQVKSLVRPVAPLPRVSLFPTDNRT